MAVNIITNGGFELGSLGGTPTDWTNVGATNIVIAEDVEKFGARSAKCDTSTSSGSMHQTFPAVVDGAVYEASGWVRGQNIVLGSGIGLGFEVQPTAGGIISLEKVSPGSLGTNQFGIAATADWTFVRYRFRIDGLTTLLMRCEHGFTGTISGQAWFDGVSVVRPFEFPRFVKPASVTPFRVSTGLVARGQTGKDQRRSIVSMGREWDETWGPIWLGDRNVQELLAFIENAYNRLLNVEILHLTTPGSGRAPHGAGGGSPLVNGASQTGRTLITDGWTANVANVARAGDVIRIRNLAPLYRIMADADSDTSGGARLEIDPPIITGSSPVDNALITRSGCFLNAYIAAPPNVPSSNDSEWIDGLTLTFRETL